MKYERSTEEREIPFTWDLKRFFFLENVVLEMNLKKWEELGQNKI